MAQFECRSGQSGTQRQCALLAALPLPLTRLVAARAPNRAPRHAIGAGASSACARTRRQRLRAGLAEDSCLCPGRAGACTAVRTCIGMVMANCEWGRRHRRRRLPHRRLLRACVAGSTLSCKPPSLFPRPSTRVESLGSEQPGPGTAPSPIPAWHPTDRPLRAQPGLPSRRTSTLNQVSSVSRCWELAARRCLDWRALAATSTPAPPLASRGPGRQSALRRAERSGARLPSPR